MALRPIAFTGATLDRADHVRSDPAALAALLGPRARLLRLEGLEPVLDDRGGLAWGSLAEAGPEAELVFLGLDGDGRGHFVAAPERVPASPHASPRSWQAMALLPGDQLAAYGTARALAGWHARHRHCAQCGAPTRPAKGGWQRDCQGCGAEHFPRTDPVTIMTVE
ncbi:MAG: NADH pyrophosphatase, partial [Proteobacteria bacterium]|nr:NADH pyrophosphatase [Pseudomonadota bacterium]